MSAREPQIQVVRTAPSAFHLRFVGKNGRRIVWSENYRRRESALRAVRVVAEFFSVNGMVWVDRNRVTISLDGNHLGAKLSIPVVDVDEREFV